MTTASLHCVNHPRREVAAKCTACGELFCRECVTNLDGRMVCSACYREKTSDKTEVKRDWFWLTWSVQLVVGVGMLWLMWWLVGRLLAGIPSEFHEGTMWETFGR